MPHKSLISFFVDLVCLLSVCLSVFFLGIDRGMRRKVRARVLSVFEKKKTGITPDRLRIHRL